MTRPELTLTEAAGACGVSRKTVRRRLDADEFPNARRLDGPAGTETGPWVIPTEDLIAAGFELHQPAGPDPTPPPTTAEPERPDVGRLDELEKENADLRRRAEVAEAIAEERGLALDDARLALRALTAHTGPQETAGAAEPPEHRSTPEAIPVGPARRSLRDLIGPRLRRR